MLRQTKEGWWIIAGDTHIGKWVEEAGRLVHDDFLVPQARLLIARGSTVIDVGANIGTHTMAYAEATGPEGVVLAFEPNPEAHECLTRNMERFKGQPRITAYPFALGATEEMAALQKDANAGASHLSAAAKDGPFGGGPIDEVARIRVQVKTLDFLLSDPQLVIPNISFIKIDAEGAELDILKGALGVLRHARPNLMLEINTGRLRENGVCVFDILALLMKTIGNFEHRLIPQTAKWGDDQYDLVVLPLPGENCWLRS